MLRIILTFVSLSILGMALSGMAAFGSPAEGAKPPARFLSVESAVFTGCSSAAEAVGQSRLGASGGTSRLLFALLDCDGTERRLGLDIFVVRTSGGFELTVRDHDSGETVVRRLHLRRPADFALSGVKLRFTVAEQTDPPA